MILIKNIDFEPSTEEIHAKIVGMILDEEYSTLDELKRYLDNFHEFESLVYEGLNALKESNSL